MEVESPEKYHVIVNLSRDKDVACHPIILTLYAEIMFTGSFFFVKK